MCGLTNWGWDASWEEAFCSEWRSAGYTPARVVREDMQVYRLWDGTTEISAQVTGKFWHDTVGKSDFPAVGDWVAFQHCPQSEQHLIHAVLPRRSAFSRHSVKGRTNEQVVAANIDTVFLITGLDGDFNPRRIERYVSTARASRATPVIILNKSDLCPNARECVAEVQTVSEGTPVFAVSAMNGSGLQKLRDHLRPSLTIAMLGMSGVGKSTLINAILGEERLATADVRANDSRGRHTTTHRELVLIPNGPILIDTPGMRQLSMWADSKKDVAAFEDIEELARHCRFSDCAHKTEPGCAVRDAIDAGQLDPKRLRSYHKVQRQFSSSLRHQADKELMLARKAYRKRRDADNGLKRRTKRRRERR